MQEAGFNDCNPENLPEYDEYWVQAAMIMHEVDNDKNLKKARENMEKRKQARKKGSKSARRQTATGQQLSAVPNTH